MSDRPISPAMGSVLGLLTGTAGLCGAVQVLETPSPPVLVALGMFVLVALVAAAAARRDEPSRALGGLVLAGIALVGGTSRIGARPEAAGSLIADWSVLGVGCLVALLAAAGLRRPAALGLLVLAAETMLWSGPAGLLQHGVALITVAVVTAALLVELKVVIDDHADGFTHAEREALNWKAAQEAYHLERQVRMARTGEVASATLRRIVELQGALDATTREDCRILEQTLRDEIRGRRLLSDAVRGAVLDARRRGAFVQVLDDGGLDDVPEDDLGRILAEVATLIAPLRSDRIVIRTGAAGSGTAVTVVGTSVDPISAALGIDDDEQVDLWREIPRAGAAAAHRRRVARRRRGAALAPAQQA